MPEVREYFPDVEKMEVHQLHARREAIMADAKNYKDGTVDSSYQSLMDEPLAELFAITRGLRKKAAAPGTGGGRKKSSPKEKPSLDSFA